MRWLSQRIRNHRLCGTMSISPFEILSLTKRHRMLMRLARDALEKQLLARRVAAWLSSVAFAGCVEYPCADRKLHRSAAFVT